MYALEEKHTHCPYCGEPISLLVDGSEAEQSYIEDCQVCCRPMVITASVEGEEIYLDVRQENE